MIPKIKLNISIILSITALTLSSCSGRPEHVIDETRFFMGTIIQIKVSVDPAKCSDEKARDAMNKAFLEIKRIEDVYSVYIESSEISKINKLRKNERLQIPDGVFNLIQKTLYYSEITDGAFDITVKPVLDLWNKSKAAGRIPDEYELKTALNKTGYKNVQLDEVSRTICFKKDGMSLDLGGAAKGYATDRAIAVLEANGIDNALVNSGGDMYCLGRRSRRELWKVGVQHPRERNKTFLEIRLKDMAIDTSGDYERYTILGGKRYSHIVDPRIGYPIGDNIVSASVIASDSTTADILATAMCILGEKGFGIIQPLDNIDAILAIKDGESLIVKTSEGIKKRYDISEERL